MIEQLGQTDMLVRIVVALGLGAVLGLERELRECPAGLRTHTLVCVGAALYTVLSLFFQGAYADPSRIAAQIVIGIGFIGGGVIFKSENKVIGLTTASTLWIAAAIGIAAGLGYFVLGAFVVLIALGVLLIGKLLEKGVLHKSHKHGTKPY